MFCLGVICKGFFLWVESLVFFLFLFFWFFKAHDVHLCAHWTENFYSGVGGGVIRREEEKRKGREGEGKERGI